MSLDIPLKPEAEKRLRELAAATNLDVAAFAQHLLERALESDETREAAIIQAYGEGRISLGQVAAFLSLPTSLEAERWLSERNVPLNYGAEDFDQDCEALAKAFPRYFPEHH